MNQRKEKQSTSVAAWIENQQSEFEWSGKRQRFRDKRPKAPLL